MWLVGALAPVVGWLAVALWPQAPRGRRLRVLMQVALCYPGFLIVILFADAGIIGDHWAVALYGSLTVAMAYGVVAGRLLLWPAVEATVPATNGEAVHVFDPVEIQ